MADGISYAISQALGLDRGDNPVRDRAAAARAALDSIMSVGTPLTDIRRTPDPVLAPRLAPTSGGYSGGPRLATGSGSWGVGNVSKLAQQYGLRMTSGYRSPAHNAAVGGVPNSRHTQGRAQDYVGSPEAMRAAAAWARANGADEVLIHNAGSGTHLHVGW